MNAKRPLTIRVLQSRGFKTFNFQLTLPFFALRSHRRLHRDQRQTPDGKPLRKSWTLGPTPASSSLPQRDAGYSWCLYEAQISCIVAGIDDQVWTTIATVDTYFDRNASKDSIDYLRRKNSGGPFDLIYRGKGGCDPNQVDAREYFLEVLSRWIERTRLEYEHVVSTMEDIIKNR